jgi:hypothetical protein
VIANLVERKNKLDSKKEKKIKQQIFQETSGYLSKIMILECKPMP